MGDSWEEGCGLNPNARPFQLGQLNANAPAFVPSQMPENGSSTDPQAHETVEDMEVEKVQQASVEEDDTQGEYPELMVQNNPMLTISTNNVKLA